MGGTAFSPQSRTYSGAPIDCIRIPASAYPNVLSHISSLISPFFESITSPKPGPGKKNHGDIDILAYNPIYTPSLSSLLLEDPSTQRQQGDEQHRTLISEIFSALKATAAVRNKPTTNFAVYIEIPGVEGEGVVKGHIQVDLHICPNQIDYKMTEFCHAYGDTWNILNTCIRDVGLSVNGEGLRMFIYHHYDHTHTGESSAAEVGGGYKMGDKMVNCKGDGGNAKDTLVLSTNPHEILKFWGLDVQKWEGEGFETQEELFGYLAGNRFFRKKMFEKGVLVYRDKKRLRKRKMFMEFVEGYVHKDKEEERNEIDVEEVRREAVEVFGKTEEYRRVVVKIEAAKEEKRIWQDIAAEMAMDIEMKRKEEEARLFIRALKKEFEKRYGSDGLQEMAEKQGIKEIEELKVITEKRRQLVIKFAEQEKEALRKEIKEELETGKLKLKKPKKKKKGTGTEAPTET